MSKFSEKELKQIEDLVLQIYGKDAQLDTCYFKFTSKKFTYRIDLVERDPNCLKVFASFYAASGSDLIKYLKRQVADLN